MYTISKRVINLLIEYNFLQHINADEHAPHVNLNLELTHTPALAGWMKRLSSYRTSSINKKKTQMNLLFIRKWKHYFFKFGKCREK